MRCVLHELHAVVDYACSSWHSKQLLTLILVALLRWAVSWRLFFVPLVVSPAYCKEFQHSLFGSKVKVVIAIFHNERSMKRSPFRDHTGLCQAALRTDSNVWLLQFELNGPFNSKTRTSAAPESLPLDYARPVQGFSSYAGSGPWRLGVHLWYDMT